MCVSLLNLGTQKNLHASLVDKKRINYKCNWNWKENQLYIYIYMLQLAHMNENQREYCMISVTELTNLCHLAPKILIFKLPRGARDAFVLFL
jgi:hypothetical protein